MRKFIAAIAASALALTGAAAGAKTVAEKGEARLAKMLEGRTAGEPVNCISTMRGSNNLEVIDQTAVVYDAGGTIYVARPSTRNQLRRGDVLVIERTNGSQLCTSDLIRTMDRSSGFMTGAVFLDKFVPYKKD